MTNPLQSRNDLPAEQTTEEAHAFWDTHEVGAGLIEEGQHDPEVQDFIRHIGLSGVPYELRLDPFKLARTQNTEVSLY